MTPRPDDVPAELVEAMFRAFYGHEPDPNGEPVLFLLGDALRATASHPAFAPWFLRQLAQREPSGPWKTTVSVQGDGPCVLFDSREDPTITRRLWTVPTQQEARAVAHALNALAAPTPPRAEEGR